MEAAEAVAVAALQGQLGDVQSVVSGLQLQLEAEQSARQQQAVAHHRQVQGLQQAMAAEQAGLLQRVTGLLEGRVTSALAALAAVDERSSLRDDANRAAAEAGIGAVVVAGLRAERAGIERMSVLQGAIGEVAAAGAAAQAAVAESMAAGLRDVAEAVAGAKGEMNRREGKLRDEVNSALQKLRGYAVEMESAFDQQRQQLEEVVRGEIVARISNDEALGVMIKGALVSLGCDVRDVGERSEEGRVRLDKKCEVLLEAQRKLYRQQQEEGEHRERLEKVRRGGWGDGDGEEMGVESEGYL